MARSTGSDVRLGGLGARALAWLVDMSVTLVAAGAYLWLVSSRPAPATLLVGAVALTIVDLAWFVLLWWSYATRGAGPGAVVAGIQVLGVDDGRPIGWGRWFLRQLIWSASLALVVPWVVLMGMMVTHHRRQGWHDLAVRSVVVRRRERAAVAAPQGDRAVAPQVTTVGLPAHLTRAGFAGAQPGLGQASASGPISAVPFDVAGSEPDAGLPPHASAGPGASRGGASREWAPAPDTRPVQQGWSGPPSAPPVQESPVPQPAWQTKPVLQGWSGPPSAPPVQESPAQDTRLVRQGWSGPPSAPPVQESPLPQPAWQTKPAQQPYAPQLAQESFAPRPGGQGQSSAAGPVDPAQQSSEFSQGWQGQAESAPRQGWQGEPAAQQRPVQQAGWAVPPGAHPPSGTVPTGAVAAAVPPPGRAEEEFEGTHLAPAASRPSASRWSVHLDDGRVIDLDRTVVLGRAPSSPAGEDAHTASISGSRMVSKSHVQIGVDERGPWISDLGSTNGTALATATGQYEPCVPGDRVRVRDGQVVSYGDRWFEVRRLG